MTTVYFIRHAQADNSVRDGKVRPLTQKGMRDRALVTEFLQDKSIDAVFSSPFKRAVDTLAEFAGKQDLAIETVRDFCERRGDSDMRKDHTDFPSFLKRQWADFSYTHSDGECLAEVQSRNIAALNRVLTQHKDKNIVIGTHGTALATIINYTNLPFRSVQKINVGAIHLREQIDFLSTFLWGIGITTIPHTASTIFGRWRIVCPVLWQCALTIRLVWKSRTSICIWNDRTAIDTG